MQTNNGDYEPASYHIFGLVNYDSLDVMVAAGSRRVSKGVSAIGGLSSVRTNINKDNKLCRKDESVLVMDMDKFKLVRKPRLSTLWRRPLLLSCNDPLSQTNAHLWRWCMLLSIRPFVRCYPA